MNVNACVLLFALIAVSSAQQTAHDIASPVRHLEAPRPASGDYRLGAGDEVEVKVFGVEDLCHTARVSSSGVISLPLLGQIEVAGRTAAEVSGDITALLTSQRLVRDPQVTVFVKEYRSQPIYVLGAVNKPGQYMITGQLRLIDVISLAGGLDLARAGDTIIVKRQTGTGSPSESGQLIHVETKSLLEGAGLALNFDLKAGDVVQVAEKKLEQFYVVGEVGRAGAFPFPREDDRPLLLSQAIASAGGPGRTAKVRKGILVRNLENGERQQFAVDFKAILQGKRPDMPVHPNDIIFIPGSTMKTLGFAFASAVPWAVSNGVIFAIP
jgi:polysaccharide biosynthesis/export protein